MFNKRKGFGLIEALIASGIIVAVAASSVGLASLIVKNTSNFDKQIVATNLASQDLEAAHWVRDYNLSDNDPTTIWSNGLDPMECETGCSMTTSSGDGSYVQAFFNNATNPRKFKFAHGEDTLTLNGVTYKRKVFIKEDNLVPTEKNRLIIESIVTDEAGHPIADLSTNLTNWREIK